MTAQPDNAALIAQARAEIEKADAGKASEPWAVRAILEDRDALAAALVAAEEERDEANEDAELATVERLHRIDAKKRAAAAEERAQAAERSNVELTALGIDRELALEDSRTQVRKLREALDALPDHVRFAISVLETTAPPREQDEGHYANRALTYLYAIHAVLARSAGQAET